MHEKIDYLVFFLITGDCCNPLSNFDYCYACNCEYDRDLLMSQQIDMIMSNCSFGFLHAIGDGFCHDELNIADCNYDGGDCCHSKTLIDVCTDCTCHNDTLIVVNKVIKGCPVHENNIINWQCDDDLNIPECNYDNQECCGSVSLSSCSECQCKDPRITNKRSKFIIYIPVYNCYYNMHHFVCILSDVTKCDFLISKGDGKCDDGNNIKECQWDDGDCCGCFVDSGFCTECTCKDDSVLKFEQTGYY
jgi:hypothetical protein